MKHGMLVIFFLSLLLVAVAGTALAEEPRALSVHDPSIIKDADGTYYVFGTHITTARSDDLIHWESVTQGYKTPGNVHFGDLSETLAGSFAWAGENDGDCRGGFGVWAPDVYYNADYRCADGSRGAYMMYYSASSTYKRSCIGLAVSKEILGPYTYVDTIIYSGFTKTEGYDENSTHNKQYTNTNLGALIADGRVSGYNDAWGIEDYNNIAYPNAIDPCIYETPSGELYMVYGSWSGGLFSLPLDRETGLPHYPGKDSTTADGRMIDRYFGTHLAGGKGWSGEGPFLYYDAETAYYYLQTTYEWLGSEGGYHIRMFRSKNPEGPFVDMNGNSAVYGDDMAQQGLKLFGNYALGAASPSYTSGGHCSTLIDDDGQRYLFYHTRFQGTEYFEMRVHPMFLNADGWPVVAPYRYRGEHLPDGGYDAAEIVGSYGFLNHGTAIGEGKTVRTAEWITLNADNTVSGAEQGTWSMDGNHCTLTLESGVYRGVFCRQTDESGAEVMTFTAAGNNATVWGSKQNNTAKPTLCYLLLALGIIMQ